MKNSKKRIIISLLIFILSLNFMVLAGPGDGSGGGHKIPLALEKSSIKNGDSLGNKPSIRLEFNKNIVNFKVKDNNIKAIKLYDSGNKQVPIVVDMKDDQVEPDKRRELTVSPKNPLSNGKYKLTVDNSFSSKSDMKLKNAVSINFTVGSGSDIDNHWAKKDIENLNRKGIMSGLGNGNFNPNGNITKGELSSILSRLLKLSKEDKGNYRDLNNKWYEKDMRKNIAAGIMSSGNGDKNLSREEFAYYIGKSFDYKKQPSKNKKMTFKDSKNINKSYEKDIENIVAYGIISGDDRGNFNPKASITRAEAAAIINRALKYLE